MLNKNGDDHNPASNEGVEWLTSQLNDDSRSNNPAPLQAKDESSSDTVRNVRDVHNNDDLDATVALPDFIPRVFQENSTTEPVVNGNSEGRGFVPAVSRSSFVSPPTVVPTSSLTDSHSPTPAPTTPLAPGGLRPPGSDEHGRRSGEQQPFDWNLKAGADHDPLVRDSLSTRVSDPSQTSRSESGIIGGVPPESPTADVPWWSPGPTKRGPKRVIMWVILGLVAISLIVGAFLVGRALPEIFRTLPLPLAVATVEAPPTSTAVLAVPSPAPPGLQKWNALGGGECIEPYISPWEQEFMVVHCDTPHAAQLVRAATWPGDATTPFPGEDALAAQIDGLCSASGTINSGVAVEFSDIQLQGSYPVTAVQWNAGQRTYYCFANRSSGELLTGSLKPVS
jgi:hypothetical protein